ncbi:MAG: zinc ribbon domain-containing protein [Fusobacteriaceae bacterium]|jgi:ribosomal protein L40E|nr:zinc ribbon domain-containing protein [Fusobacteriaceae bacterium]
MSIKDIFNKGIVDKFKDVVDINKLNLKVSSKKAEIGKLKAKLGDVVYDKYKEGAQLPDEAGEILNTIKIAEEEIAELEDKISTLKTTIKTPATQKCVKCGAENAADAKFCKACGTKLEKEPEKQPEEVKPAKVVCPVCGVECEPDARFCQECGYDLTQAPKEEPAPEEAAPVEEAPAEPAPEACDCGCGEGE